MIVVMAVQRKADIDLFGKATPIDLKFADGMIGVLPVFRTRQSAERYAGKKVTLVQIEEKPDVVQPKL
jgi:hypothetical protein